LTSARLIGLLAIALLLDCAGDLIWVGLPDYGANFTGDDSTRPVAKNAKGWGIRHCSRAVFARKLRINERTLEKWEQGRAKPNPQAAALVLLVRKYPDTLARLDEVAEG